jgi:hypothetical protein
MPASRIIVWAVTATLIIYDVIASLLRWPTISSQVRVIDHETTGLYRWILVGLWLHFFVQDHWPK